MQRTATSLVLILSALLCLCSCEGINCTLNNVVTCNIAFYSSSTGEAVSITDTLTVTAMGTDSILYNKGISTSKLSLPMSYWNEADSLILNISGSSEQYKPIIIINKSNTVHFESPDCPSVMFHVIEGVDWDNDLGLIDSVTISNPAVNYDALENIRIYLHTVE